MKKWTRLLQGNVKPTLFDLNTAGLSILAVLNSISIVTSGSPISDFVAYVIPELVFIAINEICRRKEEERFNGLFYFILSIFMMFMYGEMSGVVFFILSVKVTKRKDMIISESIVYLLSVLIYAITCEHSLTELLGMTAIISISMLIYYVSNEPKRAPSVSSIHISYEDKEILSKLCGGYTVKQIADGLYITPNAVSKRIGRLRTAFTVETTEQLVYTMAVRGIIQHNSADPPTNGH